MSKQECVKCVRAKFYAVTYMRKAELELIFGSFYSKIKEVGHTRSFLSVTIISVSCDDQLIGGGTGRPETMCPCRNVLGVSIP